MPTSEENKNQENWLKDMPIQTENIAFKAEEMVLCEKCRRNNPPNRLKCFYCAADLQLSSEQSESVKPVLRKLEMWEKGFNLIIQPDATNFGEINTAEIAKNTGFESEIVQRIVEAKKSVPLARVESENEAAIVQKILRKNGLETKIVSDESLSLNKFHRRLRGIEFFENNLILILFNQDEIVEISREDLILIVTGAIFERKTESVEKRKKGENKILDATETASDEMLIDIYSKNDAVGFRILSKGFDFSCLGAEKTMLATENMKRLSTKLKEFSPNAKIVSDYLSVREILGNVWEVETRKDSLGLKRHSFGKFDLANVSSSNNLQQFTRFSRLQRQFL
ncbi:MAG TPA: hypothetical protein PKY59_12570 [Pyrinomonadaceae bacterium]|nr:hypothetical protein [Pyrinomonadaceae bacterium]